MRTLPRPRILVLATGGTIAGTRTPGRNTGYTAGAVEGQALLARIPSPPDVEVECESLFSIGSQDMDEARWQRLWSALHTAVARENIDGVVVTHGTDTMEETAFFLDLTLHTPKPIVFIGAMRPSDAPDADGPANLRDALSVAAAPSSRERGVLVVVRGRIHAAAQVTKLHTTRLDALTTFDGASYGQIDAGKPIYWLAPLLKTGPWCHYLPSHTLAKVDILHLWAGVDLHLLEASLLHGVEGVVIAGMGHGNMPRAWLDRLAVLARQGIRVVRSSRSPGPVMRGGELDDEALGFITAGNLPPAKARILLMLCVARGLSIPACQAAFDEFCSAHP